MAAAEPTAPVGDRQWYILKVQSNREDSIREALQRRIAMHEVIKGVMPFLLSQVLVMGLLIAFPELVMLPLKWLMAK